MRTGSSVAVTRADRRVDRFNVGRGTYPAGHDGTTNTIETVGVPDLVPVCARFYDARNPSLFAKDALMYR